MTVAGADTVDRDPAQGSRQEDLDERAQDGRSEYDAYGADQRTGARDAKGDRTPHWEFDAIIQEFREAMRRRGLEPRGKLIANGKNQRCDVINDRRGRRDGMYRLHLNGPVPAGGFINYKDGLDWENWCYDNWSKLTAAERHEQKEKADAARAAQKEEHAAAVAKAAKRAARVWERATPLDQHAYLERKGVLACGARTLYGCVIVPLRDVEGNLHSLQFINADGGKRFLKDGRVVGCHFVIGDDRRKMVIAEGFATAVSIHMATDHAVVVAFNAGNLLRVANALRRKHPDAEIVIAADDDHKTKGNPGIAKAHVARGS
jgi:putative DNA primase/helicase